MSSSGSPAAEDREAHELYDGSAARSIDAATVARGFPGAALMELAGQAVATAARQAGGPVVVACGAGNNGGDGYVCARWLRQWQVPVCVFAAVPPERLQGDAAWAFRMWDAWGGRTIVASGDGDGIAAAWRAAAAGAPTVVDALLGTGMAGAVREPLARLIDTINELAATERQTVLAVDVPSGVDADRGTVAGAAVRAHATLTMGVDKLGLHSWPGRGFAGQVSVVPLPYPAAIVAKHAAAARYLGHRPAPIPPRRRDGHKGTFGTVGIMGGSASMPGAAALVALGALRSGAGKVIVVSEAGGHAQLPLEAIQRGGGAPWRSLDAGTLAGALADADAIVAGPGLGRDPGAQHVFAAVVPELAQPLVIDADGLFALSKRRWQRPVVLTPHPGEAAMMLQCSITAVQADRVGAIRALCESTGATVVLKGAGTLVGDGSRLAVSPFADPGLAVPGAGDVLAGAIAALMAQGLSPWDAACAGVVAHAAAAAGLRRIGNLAHEIADGLPAALASDPAP